MFNINRLINNGIRIIIFSMLFYADMAISESNEPYSFYMVSCGNYIEHRTTDKNLENDTADTFYVAGWISAYNRLTPNARNIPQDTDLDSVMLWLEKYCRDNPLSNLAEGLYHLSNEQHSH